MSSRQYRSRPRHRVALLAMAGLALGGCSSSIARVPVRAFDAVVPRTGRIHALLLNGGGRPNINYQSHLQHVKGVVKLLEADGVPPDDIVIFSGDGDDPALDLATRERMDQPDLWLIPKRSVLRPPVVYVNSVVDGIRLRPARKAALRRWFKEDGVWLRPGDTLLFYVTDHGHKNPKDLTNNTIVLWGEQLSVTELREMFALLDARVRVVMLMSQCYTGAFAHAIFRDGDDTLPEGNVCGYFASTADRPAYGCYPENRGKDGVGHSFQFLKALGPLGQFPEANRRVLVTDSTPDVPHTSTDFFLQQLLERKAEESGREPTALIDDLLAEAWQNRAAWEPEIRLLDRIGNAFGSFSARSLAELNEQSRALPEISKQLDTYADRWKEALESLKIENLERFFDDHPGWRDRLDSDLVKHAPASVRETLAKQLLSELVPYTEAHPARYERLLSLKQKADLAAAASYRTEVRLGVVLRMRALLTSIAGRVYLAEYGTPDERRAFKQLGACEDLSIVDDPPVKSAAALEPPKPFPPLVEEQKVAEAVMPAWMGIRYAQLTEPQHARYKTEPGAVSVMAVYPDSPAAAAHLEIGDIILGPPRAPFTEPNQIREWTMRSEIGQPRELKVRREEETLQVTLIPGPYPLEWPKLPGPPEVGSVAPPLTIDLLRGAKRLADGKPRMLFFWATWCAICKAALPEIMAFSEARHTEVVAITDEPPEKVREFLDTFDQPFPQIVAADRHRSTFQRFGVSGLPTLVLLDADGVVRHYRAGYTQKGGLGIDGWEWEAPKKISQDGASP